MRYIEERKYKVYAHINKKNGKIYIGRTGSELEHRAGLSGNGYKNCSAFYSAIEEYGWNNFEHIVIIDDLTKEESQIIEGELIEKYRTTNPSYGYNSQAGRDKSINEKQYNRCDKKNTTTCKINTFTTSIETNVSSGFKETCTNMGIKMNVVLEAFMKQFTDNEFAVKISKNGVRLEIEEK